MLKKVIILTPRKIATLPFTFFQHIEKSKNYRSTIHTLLSAGVWIYLIILVCKIITSYLNSKYQTDLTLLGDENLYDFIIRLTTLLIAYLVWVGALWVARETFDQKNIANKQIIESRKIYQYEVQPYLRLQFNPDKPERIIKITNEGRGLAKDVIFNSVDLEVMSASILNRPILTPNGGTSLISVSELMSNAIFNDGSKVPDNLFLTCRNIIEKAIDSKNLIIRISYKDILGLKYKAVFIGDNSYNDKFRISQQKRI